MCYVYQKGHALIRRDRHSGCDDCLLSHMLDTHQQAMLGTTSC